MDGAGAPPGTRTPLGPMTRPVVPGSGAGETSGERDALVNRLPNFFARTRMRKRVAMELPPLLFSSGPSFAGTVTRSSFVVPMIAFTALPPLRLKTTVFLLRPRRKERPRISSVCPICSFIGVTRVTTGALAFFVFEA